MKCWSPRRICSLIMSQKKSITVSIILWLIFYCQFDIFKLPNIYKCGDCYKRDNSTHRLDVFSYNASEDSLIDTPGCYIGNYSKLLHIKEEARSPFHCYERIVFVQKISNKEIMFLINQTKVKLDVKEYNCCYKFAKRSNDPGEEDKRIRYTPCKSFENGTITDFEEEVILVSCVFTTKKKSKEKVTYEDAYLILKKKNTDHLKVPAKEGDVMFKENWNIIIVGIDTMSRARAYSSLPKTTKYMEENNWLDYRGYNKVAINTFPNVMSILTGVNSSRAYSDCAHGMDGCKHSLIWNKFKETGYVTAFGEDHLKLPDTFSPYKGFKFPPTDHYTRPFFLTGEYLAGNYMCTKSKPSALHILEYAEQFVEAYKNDSFFGFFWLNTLGHNAPFVPSLFEDDLIDFFNNLRKSGALSNTFVFFLSDHGVRFGTMRRTSESYYEERMPMLFMWVPQEFRETHPENYYNLQLNQFRLTTPYDVHATLWKLMQLTNKDVNIPNNVECPECEGLLEEISPLRTCSSAHIEEKWCSCHNLIPTGNDLAANHSLNLAVAYIQKKADETKTKACTKCSPFELKSVLRSDLYEHNNRTYYVIAFVVSPADVTFEANVERNGEDFKLIQPTDTISTYNWPGGCVVNKYDSHFCVCVPDKRCHKKSNKKKDKT